MMNDSIAKGSGKDAIKFKNFSTAETLLSSIKFTREGNNLVLSYTKGDSVSLYKFFTVGTSFTKLISNDGVKTSLSSILKTSYITTNGDTDKENTIKASDYNDLIKGGNLADTIYGYKGNDKIYGYEGDDKLYGYEGNDILYGGDGNDYIHGGYGNDYIDGGSGDDTIHGYSGTNTLKGNAGNDIIYGGDEDDTIYGGVGDDRIETGSGDDMVIFEANHDTQNLSIYIFVTKFTRPIMKETINCFKGGKTMFTMYKNGNGCEWLLGKTEKGWTLISLYNGTYDRTLFSTEEEAIHYMGTTAKKVEA